MSCFAAPRATISISFGKRALQSLGFIPRRGVVRLLWQAGDVFAGILQRGQLTASGQGYGV
jgi:hypothetical protein